MLADINSLGASGNPWETILDRWLAGCLHCFPAIHKKINWKKSIEKLDQIASSTQSAEAHDPSNPDLLYQVYSLEEEPVLLWIHIANSLVSQATTTALFESYARLLLHYRLPILPMVILGKTAELGIAQGEALAVPTHQLRFQTLSLQQWKGQEASLLKSKNLFESAISIYLQTEKIPEEAEVLYEVRLKLHRDLLEVDMSKEDFLCLYTFMDNLIPLPAPLHKQYYEEIYHLERIKKVDYLTNDTQYGILQWSQQGFKKGAESKRNEILQNMLEQGVDREKILAIFKMSNKELNSFLISRYDMRSDLSPPSITDAIDKDLQGI